MKSPLDAYAFRARLLPALISATPLPIAIMTAYPGGLDLWTPLWTVLVACGATTLLAELARDGGKKKEAVLFQKWGGKPTTLRLRHRGAENAARIERVHRRIASVQPELPLPSPELEVEHPLAADDRYDVAVAFLREHTRDRDRYPLVFEELCSYGFRRNLWGLKPCGLLCCVIGLALSSAAVAASFQEMLVVPCALLGVGVALQLVLALFWILGVTPEWVKPAAFSYADALISTVEK